MFTITRITAAIAVIAVALAAGTSLAGPPATGETVTLTLANPESQGRPASQIAERFARTVATRSKGTVKVRIVYADSDGAEHTMARSQRSESDARKPPPKPAMGRATTIVNPFDIVLRELSWQLLADAARSAERMCAPRDARYVNCGFRCAKNLP